MKLGCRRNVDSLCTDSENQEMKMYETSNKVRFKVLKQIISNSKSKTIAFNP